MSAESANGSTPGVRVTWSTTAPPECVASVTVVFRPSEFGSVVTTYTTTNTSGTQVIQSPLQCATEYYIRVFVKGESQRLGGMERQSIQKRVVVGGEENREYEISIGTILKFLVLIFLHTQCGQFCDEDI